MPVPVEGTVLLWGGVSYVSVPVLLMLVNSAHLHLYASAAARCKPD